LKENGLSNMVLIFTDEVGYVTGWKRVGYAPFQYKQLDDLPIAKSVSAKHDMQAQQYF
jgi:hypothetical protein